MNEETLDEILNGLVRVFQKKRGYRFSIDALLLAHFVSLQARSKALDLGTGSGIIPLILANRFPHTSWTGLEIQANMAQLADKNVQLNGLQERIAIVHGDARKSRNMFAAHFFDAVTCNPPYRKINSGRINPGEEKAIARHEIEGSLKDFLHAAKYLLKPGGKFFAIYPAKRLVELVSLFRASSMEPKRMKLVFTNEASNAVFVLAEGRYGSREELKIEPALFIYDQDKRYTRQMNDIFSDLAGAASGGDG
ncbi:MAG: tRNA1(Val) (adenine(37)-N6)-methyltransferase [Smithella sp.]